MTDIVQKLWGFCHKLRHDGIGYPEYVDQLTYLMFLKMAAERGLSLPKGCSWADLCEQNEDRLIPSYGAILRTLGSQAGLVGDIYARAEVRFTKPSTLKHLIAEIDQIPWSSANIDVKAAAYEGLLEKVASEGKKGAGQLFTPTVLVESIVRCVQPDPRAGKPFTICDPACGTAGFLVASYKWLMSITKQGNELDQATAKRVKSKTYFGQDIGETPRRLALMNLLLHGLEPEIKLGDTIYNVPDRQQWCDVVLTNPPFGTKGANEAPQRDDFRVSTSNKQLNFVQHILTILKTGGRAAVVLPDNCLFNDQAGSVFKILTEMCNLHTLLRLPRGTFTPYSQGVKANVVFFTKGEPTATIWIYDARTNVPGITKKDRPLTEEHFAEFEKCYGTDPNGLSKRKVGDSPSGSGYLGGDRWRRFTIKEVRERNFKLDGFRWLKDETVDGGNGLPEPEELVTDAISELQRAVDRLNAILAMLENGYGAAAAGRT